MRHHLTPGLALLRAVGGAALLLLLWNPVTSRTEPSPSAPLVLLDASLSMAAHGGHWRGALDTARALAKGGGVIWRFGRVVRGFDSLPPADGATRLAPALAAAAGRGGPVIVVTDGAISDAPDVPPDLLRRARVVVLPRAPFFDAFVSDIEGPQRVAAGDTVRLRVSYGTAGKRETGGGKREALLTVNSEHRRLASQRVPLPDSGTKTADLTLPASRLPHPGFSALEVRLEGVKDSEPRDDARWFVTELSPQPSVVVLAAPPDWDTRFLARTLSEVARVPVRTFVAAETGRGAWRDAATLAPVPAAEITRAVAAARLVVRAGDPAAFAGLPTPKGAILSWPTTRGQEGDWYVQSPGPSPLAGALAGIAWDSLPPAASLVELAPDTAAVVVLTARLARRGAPRALVVVRGGEGGERDGVRRATIAASGLYRWAFRGGSSAEAYRALVAALADWLLEGERGIGKGERAVPEMRVVPNGLPSVWRWTGTSAPGDVVLNLAGEGRTRVDTLRFDPTGRAELALPPGVYSYAAVAGGEHGVVAVDSSSVEWRPATPLLKSQDGAAGGRVVTTALRDRWWLFVVAITAFAAEWAWRRRQGLP